MLACNARFEMNIKRRYILKPYVQKRFQQHLLLSGKKPCFLTILVLRHTKRMKEINDASKLSKQITRQSTYSARGSKTFSWRPAYRGRGTP